MSYRPITDFWLLARCKYKNRIKRFGGYVGGFPERARVLLGCSIYDPVLHVCGGLAKHYPYKGGFGVADKTMDLDPMTFPDILHDVREPFPIPFKQPLNTNNSDDYSIWTPKGYLCDPPYSEEDAKNYSPGSEKYPSPNLILNNCANVMRLGERVGIIHYMLPARPKNCKFIACVGIICGHNNKIRCFSVFERVN